jgi:hypothetical protein
MQTVTPIPASNIRLSDKKFTETWPKPYNIHQVMNGENVDHITLTWRQHTRTQVKLLLPTDSLPVCDDR